MQLRLSLTLSAGRAKMQQALTDKLAEDGEAPFTLVWGTGRATNSSVPANVHQMSRRQLATFVHRLQKGCMEMSKELHTIPPVVDHTFCIYAVNGSKYGHDHDGMCPAEVRPCCVLERCGAIVKVGAMSTKGTKHPEERYGTPPCLLYIYVSLDSNEATRPTARPHIDHRGHVTVARSYGRSGDYAPCLRGARSSACVGLDGVHLCR